MKKNEEEQNNIDRLHRAKIIDKTLIQPDLWKKINRLSEDEVDALVQVRRKLGEIDPQNVPPGIRNLFL